MDTCCAPPSPPLPHQSLPCWTGPRSRQEGGIPDLLQCEISPEASHSVAEQIQGRIQPPARNQGHKPSLATATHSLLYPRVKFKVSPTLGVFNCLDRGSRAVDVSLFKQNPGLARMTNKVLKNRGLIPCFVLPAVSRLPSPPPPHILLQASITLLVATRMCRLSSGIIFLEEMCLPRGKQSYY